MIETSRLDAIISLVRSLELQSTSVAFVKGVVVTKQALLTLAGKLAFGIFLASQYTLFFSSSLTFSHHADRAVVGDASSLLSPAACNCSCSSTP